MQSVLVKLQTRLPDITFDAGEAFYWSPKHSRIIYKETALKQPKGRWALLHEAGHALLNHSRYESDIELLLLEVAAWEAARELGKSIDIPIDSDHIEDCLDSYRDWLHQRSTCPVCGCNSLQETSQLYSCFNCFARWSVSPSRFCRPYRRMHSQIQKTSPLTEKQSGAMFR